MPFRCCLGGRSARGDIARRRSRPRARPSTAPRRAGRTCSAPERGGDPIARPRAPRRVRRSDRPGRLPHLARSRSPCRRPEPTSVAAWTLIGFEAIPLVGMAFRLVTLWNIDSAAPAPVTRAPGGMRVAVLIPTYDEPAEVIAPTIAAACALATGPRDLGARRRRPAVGQRRSPRRTAPATSAGEVHDHAKAGNLNHALDVMALEASGWHEEPIDVVAVLDCDHVPLPTFLTATLGLVRRPRDRPGAGRRRPSTTPARSTTTASTASRACSSTCCCGHGNRRGAGPFWCGSTSLLRDRRAARDRRRRDRDDHRGHAHHAQADPGRLAHRRTTTRPSPSGWRRRRRTVPAAASPWGLGAMQVVTKERLWAAKRWLSWRNYHEYLTGTLWWLEGVGVPVAFLVARGGPPAVSGATDLDRRSVRPSPRSSSRCSAVRLWGAKRLCAAQLQLAQGVRPAHPARPGRRRLPVVAAHPATTSSSRSRRRAARTDASVGGCRGSSAVLVAGLAALLVYAVGRPGRSGALARRHPARR